MLINQKINEADLQWAKNLAEEYYNLNAQVTALHGDVDQNFYLKTGKGEEFVLKIASDSNDLDNLNFQNDLARFLEDSDLEMPRAIPDKSGNYIAIHQGTDKKYFVRLFNWIPGRLFAQCNPRSDKLLYSLGEFTGQLSQALKDFDHPGAHKNFDWDPAQGSWVEDYLDMFTGKEKEIVSYFLKIFKQIQSDLEHLPEKVNHNDINDYNIIVTQELKAPEVRSVIDFGDALYTHAINELAIALTYAIMEFEDPLEASIPVIRGYHKHYPITEQELRVLYGLIGSRLIISVTKAALNKKENPGNDYHQISNRQAWDLLKKWKNIHPSLAEYTFRYACGYEPCRYRHLYDTWLKKNKDKIAPLTDIQTSGLGYFMDLSIGSLELSNHASFLDPDRFERNASIILKDRNADYSLGRYDEARPIYTSDAYMDKGNSGPRWRTVHLGLDIFKEAFMPIYAPLDGVIESATVNDLDKDYGPTIILKHEVENLVFYTLYGHLSMESIQDKKEGQYIEKGTEIAEAGDPSENGNWPPHLHFQIILDMLDFKGDYPGAAFPEFSEIWKSICPDPYLFQGIEPPEDKKISTEQIIEKRKEQIGPNLSISYDQPLQIVRGYKQHLYEIKGRRYLDLVNNVAHVGHEHPRVVNAGQKQMAVLNTNTRYLHKELILFSEKLISTLPEELSVCYIVNSGSEANELALRMAESVTGSREMIVIENGYHGNTMSCVDISSYKFDGKGGKGAPDHIHVVPMPDTYRGLYREDQKMSYADHIREKIDLLQSRGKPLSGFIHESILSCGGQVPLPEGYLQRSYELVRESGGVCIADEVQTGLGRVGEKFYAFELHDVVPDIVTLGKPLGNGHPVAAVVVKKEIAEAFNTGMEYFNTFGGNPVSCVIGKEVLSVIEDEELQKNALDRGKKLKNMLKSLQKDYKVIGNIRGNGLFLGIELVDDPVKLVPATEKAEYLVNRMRTYGILLSIDGPDENVIKIKPPMCITDKDLDLVIEYLERVLKEDFMKIRLGQSA